MNAERENQPVVLCPCPFCGGPPVTIITNAFYPRQPAEKLADYGDDGLDVESYVYCHECGARGQKAEDRIYDAEHYAEVIAEGVALWNTRNERHGDLYASSAAAGRNLFPRADE
ncbi:hypothetical protein EB795_31810 [Pseudomonas mandelii]|uniref:Lar family restriction alleviation protein n=1 Tax=Pseudomonas mandelii TaxID=75612 RepID=UPI0012B42CFE|nr:Lar family restriction alleviation protein [Pseudomonas mandelii]MSU98452.1 hypothetical protein [Pseudomonas mandelii]